MLLSFKKQLFPCRIVVLVNAELVPLGDTSSVFVSLKEDVLADKLGEVVAPLSVLSAFVWFNLTFIHPGGSIVENPSVAGNQALKLVEGRRFLDFREGFDTLSQDQSDRGGRIFGRQLAIVSDIVDDDRVDVGEEEAYGDGDDTGSHVDY